MGSSVVRLNLRSAYKKQTHKQIKKISKHGNNSKMRSDVRNAISQAGWTAKGNGQSSLTTNESKVHRSSANQRALSFSKDRSLLGHEG